MTDLFPFVPVLAGAVFSTVGLLSLRTFFVLQREATRVEGRVKAIEKYVSHSSSGGGRSSTLMFRPLVEYSYEGEARTLRGLSVNQLRHRLGQSVEVLVRQDPESGHVSARINDSLYVFLGSVFLFVGLIALAVGLLVAKAATGPALALVALVFGLGFAISRAVGRLGVLTQGDDGTAAPREDVTLIETQEAMEQEVAVHQKVGFVLALLPLLGGLWMFYSGLSGLSAAEYDALVSGPVEFLKANRSDKSVLLGAIGAFFAATGLYSFLFQSRQYAYLLKR